MPAVSTLLAWWAGIDAAWAVGGACSMGKARPTPLLQLLCFGAKFGQHSARVLQSPPFGGGHPLVFEHRLLGLDLVDE